MLHKNVNDEPAKTLFISLLSYQDEDLHQVSHEKIQITLCNWEI